MSLILKQALITEKKIILQENGDLTNQQYHHLTITKYAEELTLGKTR